MVATRDAATPVNHLLEVGNELGIRPWAPAPLPLQNNSGKPRENCGNGAVGHTVALLFASPARRQSCCRFGVRLLPGNLRRGLSRLGDAREIADTVIRSPDQLEAGDWERWALEEQCGA